MKQTPTTKKRQLCKDYLCARKKFRDAADTIADLAGNDNIVGRIGEFIALQFLRDFCGKQDAIRNTSPVETGYDILTDNGTVEVSVKIITAENVRGRVGRLSKWDELVLVELDYCSVTRIGYLKKDALIRKHPNSKPVVRRSMLNNRGLIGQYGKVYSGKEVANYL